MFCCAFGRFRLQNYQFKIGAWSKPSTGVTKHQINHYKNLEIALTCFEVFIHPFSLENFVIRNTKGEKLVVFLSISLAVKGNRGVSKEKEYC